MPGISINTKGLNVLQQSIDDGDSPSGVLKVLSGAEYKAYCGNAPVEVIRALRQRIFGGTNLPEDFLAQTALFDELSLTSALIENSEEIAILCECSDSNELEGIRGWIIKKLANHFETSETQMPCNIKFAKSRTWLDGPVAVIIVNDERNIADNGKYPVF